MIVEMQDIVKRYGDLVALDHFDLQVNQGEIYGLLGPNGCGKTTAINCMLSLISYDKGWVKLFGEDMAPDRHDIKDRIGLVMQEIGVYDELTVEENIDYFCGLYIRDKASRKAYVEEAIDFVGINSHRKFKPPKLSGGLKRRLNLACGIAHKPDLIILDEPTVAVDPQSRNRILENIKALAQEGKTIVYTSHYMEEVQAICDRLTIMDKGRILVTGTVEEIIDLSQLGTIARVKAYQLEEAALEAIRNLEGVTLADYDPIKSQLTVTFAKGQADIKGLLALMDEKGLAYYDLAASSPSLNDVFLEITGKELRDNA